MVTNKLYLDDRIDEKIIMCKFGSHTIRGYRVTEAPIPPVPGSSKKPGLNRVKLYILHVNLLIPIEYASFHIHFSNMDISYCGMKFSKH